MLLFEGVRKRDYKNKHIFWHPLPICITVWEGFVLSGPDGRVWQALRSVKSVGYLGEKMRTVSATL